MKLRLSVPEKILFLSISFTLLLLAVRTFYSHTNDYRFYPWNLFLAVIPLYFSRKLHNCEGIGWKSILLIACWLLFFPNAPYIITDIFHFYQRPGVPLWYDLLLVFSASWNGLLITFMSLVQVDKFIGRHTTKKWSVAIIGLLLFTTSNGIYLGRFLRFNSWDVVTKPGSLVQLAFSYTSMPFHHLQAWAFCIICTALLLLIYYSIKNLPVLMANSKK